MTTFVILSRISPQAFDDPKAIHSRRPTCHDHFSLATRRRPYIQDCRQLSHNMMMSNWPHARNRNAVIFFKHCTISSLGALITEMLANSRWSNAGVD